MEEFILWCAFVGAWLLFAGPIYQAALELKDEAIAFKSLNIPRFKNNVSAWWWLVPPIKIFLETKKANKFQIAYINKLSDTEIKTAMSFINKSRAWTFVSLGGLMIAFKETYALVVGLHLNTLWFWPIVVIFTTFILFFTAWQIAKSERLVNSKSKQTKEKQLN